MKYAENILGLVGHTPLVKLNRLADAAEDVFCVESVSITRRVSASPRRVPSRHWK